MFCGHFCRLVIWMSASTFFFANVTLSGAATPKA